MTDRWAMIGAAFLMAILIAACIVATLKIDVAPKPVAAAKPPRYQELGEGVSIRQHGLYGVDLVSIGHAYIRKLRKGPFVIGAINELVLEDVTLNLPEEVWNETGAVKTDAVNNESASGSQGGPRAMLAKMGVNAGHLKMGGRMPSFSALAIRRLAVSRLNGTNAVPWFSAARGEAVRRGLKLENGISVEDGQSVTWREAMLVFEPKLRLFTRPSPR